MNIKNRKILDRVHLVQIAYGISNPTKTMEFIIDEYFSNLSDVDKIRINKANELLEIDKIKTFQITNNPNK